jgi:hypothetical protein
MAHSHRADTTDTRRSGVCLPRYLVPTQTFCNWLSVCTQQVMGSARRRGAGSVVVVVMYIATVSACEPHPDSASVVQVGDPTIQLHRMRSTAS